MNKRVLLAAAMAALLTACSSGVKLDDVPVEDRNKAGVVAPEGATGPGSQRGVEQVRVDPLAGDRAGPQNVARIIYFDYDSNEIKPQFQQLIEAHARYLKASGARHVVIEGHTDERGGSEYNLALGQRRAEAVRRALGLLGVGDAQVEAVSMGKEKPAIEGHDESAWQQNRRAEIAYR
ncbi:peptidoglycan-associated lipoprotein Pal [Ramlibacter sp. XY19]|uniref:peptidoglycan-associated lipoprotein Pal n=1 Tax=Ramlibacter paludis TaxID=2908000 RepID=UPI0023D9D070|nr:peptidoglycan-associated lipoprotein Pal [Ramlibacter paludis]MCG2593433.1 peptidoglycan-associated lipoprotein Pal [Ramlibacter paludis]